MKVGDLEHFKNMSFLAHSTRGALRIVINHIPAILVFKYKQYLMNVDGGGV